MLSKLPGYRFMQAMRDLVKGGDRGIAAELRVRRTKDLFQPFGDTLDDRYPEIFATLRHLIGEGTPAEMLSYGCSTGEEVFTLRRYFPKAIIGGIDISTKRIAIAKQRLAEAGQAGEGLSFAVSANPENEPQAHYDVVFAMAVFRHGDLSDGPPSAKGKIDFESFNAMLTTLAKCIKPGGYLAVRHANFLVLDADVARDFRVIMSDRNITPNYDRSGRLLPTIATEPCLFQKNALPVQAN